MTNSAHDDISLISDCKPEDLKTNDEDIRKIYKLIQDMQLGEELGPVNIQRQKISLALKPSVDTSNPEAFVELIVNSIISESKGWLAGDLNSQLELEVTPQLSKEDINAIRNNDFSMTISLCDEGNSMPFDKLLKKLEVYEAGRPSTIASIIEKLIQDKGLLSVTDGHGIALTQEGREAYEVLQENFGGVANLRWNLEFASSMSFVGDGSLPPNDVLLSVFEKIYDHNRKEDVNNRKEDVNNLVWNDPNVLYQEVEAATPIASRKILIGKLFEE